MKRIKILIVLIISLLGFESLQSQTQQQEIDILFNKLYNQFSKSFSDGSTMANVTTWYNSQNADGTWTDITNDGDNSYIKMTGGYCPNKHLDRTNAMIVAYINNTIAGNTYYHNPLMLAKIKLALNQNLKHIQATVFSNTGFYQAYISGPPLYARSLILMKTELSAAEYKIYSDHMHDILKIKDISINTGYGLNFIGEANSNIYQGIAAGNYAMIKDGIDTVADDLRIKSIDDKKNNALGQGIKADFSWHEHGIQLYSGGYGLQALNTYTSLMILTMGTNVGKVFTPKIKLFSDFVLEGTRWLSYRSISDIASIGRTISRVGGTNSIYPQQISPIIQIDPANTAAYNTWINHVKYNGPSGIIGNKHFWKSDVMVHRGANYYMSAKILSIRRAGTEYMTDENLKYKNLLPLGYTQIYTSGKEYTGIFPLWDWGRIPGMTGEMKEILTRKTTIPKNTPPNDAPFGPNDYAGGVSSSGGTVGFMAYKATFNGISANKAYFFIGDAMFCLGSGISGNKANDIVTSVNQAFANGTITFNNGTNQTFTTGTQNYTNIEWIHHDNVGYIFPDTGSVTVQNITQKSDSGSWLNIGTNKTVINPANIFSVWFNHGKTPNNSTYQYIVAPDKNLAAFQTFAANPGFVVVQNDGNIQAIHNSNYNVDAIVFYQAGPINMKDGLTVQVDKPSLVLIEKNTAGYNVTVSDPNYNTANKSVLVTINNQPTTINLPSGDYLGSSISKQVNLCATTPPAIITAASATTFCSGGSVVLNANTGTGLTYKWMNGTIVAGTASNIKATNSGSYTVVVTNASGCSATSTATTVTVNPIPTISAGINAAICSGKSVTLTATGGANYKWSNAVSLATNIVFPLVTTTYIVTGTSVSACSSTSAVVVTVNALPTINAGLTVSICSGKSTTLTASGGNSYTWSNGIAFASTSVSPTVTSTYIVTGTNSASCSSTSSVVVTVNALPSITPYLQVNALVWIPINSVSVNEGSSVSFGPLPTVAAGWLWTGPNSFSSSIRTATITNIAPINQGIYTATYTDVNSCIAKINFTLSVLSKQTISLVQGWNLISTNVQPTDSSIATLFAGLDVQEIKTNDSFWRKGQNVAINSLKTISSGQGYLVYMNVAGTLQISGISSTKTLQATSLHKGWNLIGCPYQTSISLLSIFNTSNTNLVKDFEGFWIPGGTLNSINIIMPGKGYFVNSK